MNSFIPIFSAFFILLGLLVWRFPKLIAGYNTMTPEQQKKVDVSNRKKSTSKGSKPSCAVCSVQSAYWFS